MTELEKGRPMSDAARLAEELEAQRVGRDKHGGRTLLGLTDDKWDTVIAALRAPAPMPEDGAEPTGHFRKSASGGWWLDAPGYSTAILANDPRTEIPIYDATALQAARREALQEAAKVIEHNAEAYSWPTGQAMAIRHSAALIRALPGAK